MGGVGGAGGGRGYWGWQGMAECEAKAMGKVEWEKRKDAEWTGLERWKGRG